jgi:DNA-binding MarR family transcriptional regulator
LYAAACHKNEREDAVMARKESALGTHSSIILERLARLMRAAEHDGDLNPAQWEALRYLARANQFSNSPAALTRYLGATKGTISQTIMALERKGYVTKAERPGEKRSVTLTLTTKGEEKLSQDPWAKLSVDIDDLGGKTRRRLAQGLNELLGVQLKQGNFKSFGFCETCRFFRDSDRIAGAEPYRCILFDLPLSSAASTRICVEHQPAKPE